MCCHGCDLLKLMVCVTQRQRTQRHSSLRRKSAGSFRGNRILVDDEVYPAAPVGTTVIGINVQNGKVTLTADGQPITKQ